MSDNKKVQIIKQSGNLTLLRYKLEHKIGNETYFGTRYEIWTDTEKMNQGIHGEDGYIYCRGFAGASEQAVIKIFDNMIKEELPCTN